MFIPSFNFNHNNRIFTNLWQSGYFKNNIIMIAIKIQQK